MTDETDIPDAAPITPIALSAGVRLREARAAAGLSIDAVAQQLKLAPRQVKALEDDDFAALPGRTFVRGFVRNYARLLRLDTLEVLAALPDGDAAHSLDRPSLAPTPRAMGEIPADQHAKPGSARWAIPLALVAIVAIAAVYEWTRAVPENPRGSGDHKGTAVAIPTPVLPPATTPADTAAPAPSVPEPAQSTDVVKPTSGTAAMPDNAPMVLVFRGSSWVEIKDGKGALLLSTMGFPGATHAVDGVAPLDVVIGNAEAVAVTVRGEAFDLSPFIRQNVAKFTVK
ncbi:MAG: RodZ domain-containing protein [Betaproteobacteria bacterium]